MEERPGKRRRDRGPRFARFAHLRETARNSLWSGFYGVSLYLLLRS
jgi:hypothetical protein